ncbi:hypothetical protein Pfo_003442 [Paulownia fortunei]|nr:hypothetical protein Pfo_003442 [Paulownia fortunei]
MAAESPVVCENPQAVRVAPPRYGPGNLIARFTSSDRESRKIITAPAKFQAQMIIIIIIIIITYRSVGSQERVKPYAKRASTLQNTIKQTQTQTQKTEFVRMEVQNPVSFSCFLQGLLIFFLN